MITCDTMTKTDTKNLIFMPVGIMPYLGDSLQAANIPFQVYNWRSFVLNKNPYEIQPEYKAVIEATREKYQHAGYLDTTCIMAIEANLDPQEVFEKSLLTFGKYMDPDLKHKLEESARQADANEEYYIDDTYFK